MNVNTLWNAAISVFRTKNVAAQLVANPITLEELNAGLMTLQTVSWPEVSTALTSKFGNARADLVTLEMVAEVLSDFGVPFASDVEIVLKITAFVLSALPNSSSLNPTKASPGGSETAKANGQ